MNKLDIGNITWAESTEFSKFMGDVRLIELLAFVRDCEIPNDAEIWIEYPERYGTAQPRESIFRQTNDGGSVPDDKTDFIRCMSYSYSKEDNILYIRHHY